MFSAMFLSPFMSTACCLNPCFSGSYVLCDLPFDDPEDSENRLNPCFSGSYVLCENKNAEIFKQYKVLILVLVEVMFSGIIKKA